MSVKLLLLVGSVLLSLGGVVIFGSVLLIDLARATIPEAGDLSSSSLLPLGRVDAPSLNGKDTLCVPLCSGPVISYDPTGGAWALYTCGVDRAMIGLRLGP